MDLRDLLRTLRREWIPALLAFAVVVAAAVGLAASAPEQYRSQATLFVQPADGETTFGSVQAVSFLMPALEARVSSAALRRKVLGRAPAAYAGAAWAAAAESEPGTGLLRLSVLSGDAAVVRPVAAAYVDELRQFVRTAEVPLTIAVLDPPGEPFGLASRRWLSLLPSGIVLGIGAGVVAALLAGRIRRPRLLADLIRTRYGVNVLGEVPRLHRRADPSPLRLYDSEEQGAIEAFMRLRTSIEIEIAARRINSLAVISRGLGEGKTTIASHIGWSLAALGHRVRLADADLRHAGLDTLMRPAVLFKAAQEPAELERQRTSVRHLTYTSARGLRRAGVGGDSARRTQHPAEAVSAGLPRVLEVAYAEGVLAVIDSPPVLGAAESKFVVSVVDATVVVVDATRPLALEDLEDTLRQVSEAGGTVLGVVLNRAKLPRAAQREQQMYYVRRPELSGDRRYRIPQNRPFGSGSATPTRAAFSADAAATTDVSSGLPEGVVEGSNPLAPTARGAAPGSPPAVEEAQGTAPLSKHTNARREAAARGADAPAAVRDESDEPGGDPSPQHEAVAASWSDDATRSDRPEPVRSGGGTLPTRTTRRDAAAPGAQPADDAVRVAAEGLPLAGTGPARIAPTPAPMSPDAAGSPADTTAATQGPLARLRTRARTAREVPGTPPYTV